MVPLSRFCTSSPLLDPFLGSWDGSGLVDGLVDFLRFDGDLFGSTRAVSDLLGVLVVFLALVVLLDMGLRSVEEPGVAASSGSLSEESRFMSRFCLLAGWAVVIPAVETRNREASKLRSWTSSAELDDQRTAIGGGGEACLA